MGIADKVNNKKHQGTVFVCPFVSWEESVRSLLDKAGLAEQIQDRKQILIKPNLVEAIDPPVTTPVGLVAAIVAYIQEKAPGATVAMGEGTGATEYDTWHPFEKLGYIDLARHLNLELIDLNEAPLVKRTKSHCQRWPEMYLPEIIYESYLISVPVLKAHTLAGVTLTMKNMMGAAPPAYYQQGGHWKKASFHTGIQEAIFDLNRYRTPDFTILDATVGMPKAHLWGPHCNPKPNKLAASFDPVAVDAYGTSLLCRQWQQIGHIRMAHGELGIADPLCVNAI